MYKFLKLCPKLNYCAKPLSPQLLNTICFTNIKMDVIGWLKNFISSSKRVLLVSRKPDWKEYSVMAKVTGIGIVAIATVGFFITLFFKVLGLGS